MLVMRTWQTAGECCWVVFRLGKCGPGLAWIGALSMAAIWVL